MGVGVSFDPLTCDVETLYFYTTLRYGDSDCDCPAKDKPMALHDENCSIAPIYASTVPDNYQMLIGSFHAATARITQTVIKCAECGKERLGRDLLVIYQAPIYSDTPIPHYKYPYNIVKAVCPEHGRNGKVGLFHGRV